MAGPMIPAEICRAALCEAGRPDLARNIGTNRAGYPTRVWTAYYGSDAELVAKAFAVTYGDALKPESMPHLVAMLRQEISPECPAVRHWSPRLRRWVIDFDRSDWEGIES